MVSSSVQQTKEDDLYQPITISGGDGTKGTIHVRLMVGMEIHVELATRTKMWTGAPNVAHPENFAAAPNTLLDPVVIGMPGTLPIMNRQALEMSVKFGLALGCKIGVPHADETHYSKWDRKSYYYPDLPKNYQLSQYDLPIVGEGEVEIPLSDDPNGPSKSFRLIRAHLEEDAGKLSHEAPGGQPIDFSIVDLNRAGTPLLEIVTEPDFTNANEAVAFGQTLRQICRTLGISEGIMQKGHMRFEPNINVLIKPEIDITHPDATDKDGKPVTLVSNAGHIYKTPIVEIKNLNSFKAVHGAIEFEYKRQIKAWLKQGKVLEPGAKSTRGWDDNKMETLKQRDKEDAHQYRYFPCPDLVPVTLDQATISRLGSDIPELPLSRARRFVNVLKLNEKDALQLLEEPRVADFYDAVLQGDQKLDPVKTAKLFLNNAAKIANEREIRLDQMGISVEQMIGVLTLHAQGAVGDVDGLLKACCGSDMSAAQLAEELGLLKMKDTGALEGFVDQVLADAKNAKAIDDIQGGKDKAIGALLGQIMKLSKGQADAQTVREIIFKKLRS